MEEKIKEVKLSSVEVKAFTGLAVLREEAKKAFEEITNAEMSQMSLLAEHYGLAEGRYRLRQAAEGDVFLYVEELVSGSSAPSNTAGE